MTNLYVALLATIVMACVWVFIYGVVCVADWLFQAVAKEIPK